MTQTELVYAYFVDNILNINYQLDMENNQ